ncbi:hypothetical protein ACHQM5_004989 [Ranunculus cassubicifolius]
MESAYFRLPKREETKETWKSKCELKEQPKGHFVLFVLLRLITRYHKRKLEKGWMQNLEEINLVPVNHVVSQDDVYLRSKSLWN